jgi:hypothetical protein
MPASMALDEDATRRRHPGSEQAGLMMGRHQASEGAGGLCQKPRALRGGDLLTRGPFDAFQWHRDVPSRHLC